MILAQDRLPDPLTQVLAGKECYDGQLTAEHIRRTWKLDAELVTLKGLGHGGQEFYESQRGVEFLLGR